MRDGGKQPVFHCPQQQKYTIDPRVLASKQHKRSGIAQAHCYACRLAIIVLTEEVLAGEQALETPWALLRYLRLGRSPETKLIVDAIVRETGACNVQVIGKTLCCISSKERKISRALRDITKSNTKSMYKTRFSSREQIPRSLPRWPPLCGLSHLYNTQQFKPSTA